MKITPMLEQYLRVKDRHRDAIVFFRLGDFYEVFFEDAEIAAPILEVALTTRSKKDEVQIPMCGVPYHAVQPYVAKLLAVGRKVAIVEQIEDPATAKGLVARAVVRVITPGTVTEEECLDPKAPNYLVAVVRGGSEPGGDSVGVAAVDLSTGEVRVSTLPDTAVLADELGRLGPRELLVSATDEALAAAAIALVPDVSTSRLPADDFRVDAADEWLARSGAPALPAAARAALAGCLRYIAATHRAGTAHLRLVDLGGGHDRLVLDQATRRNLELLTTLRGERRGALLWVLDRTATPMGGRLLRQWLVAPLTDLAAIGERLDAVEYLREHPSLRQDIEADLKPIGDIERLNGRLAAARVTPRDVAGLAANLERVARIRTRLVAPAPSVLTAAAADLDAMPDTAARIAATLVDSPPLAVSAGGLIRAGCDAEVDEFRTLAHSGKQWISEYEAAERRRTGIGSLKVRYNQVFGYYIEVTRPNLPQVPADYQRKQTTANAERFTTPQLGEYEAKVVGAEERLRAREAEIFAALVADLAAQQERIGRTAATLARLDVLSALAAVAERHQYVRPQLTRDRRLVIRDGRHPVVEALAGRGGFVPNDCTLDPDGPQILTITGPNMAGKSTYLRQVALIVLLAQMGSFVPASAAEIGLVDRLFTRVGASDNLAGGESTFMVEMKETAEILGNLTSRSLVVLDEIGRGTSTFDGISIAWAVAEHLHAAPGRPLVLFATHYHELTDLARTQARIGNASVAVREWKGEVVFLRRIVPGPASQSYGIQVATLAGVPSPVIERARQILRNLEAGELDDAGRPRLAEGTANAGPQLALFAPPQNRLRDELAAMDVNRLTPMEALARLHELVERARKDA
ncbi:DNA mismatch repair protein MutS [Candidatus Binatia bacterium]|nr:DNA mismatch repair protein MutS [Candidatus Binatia bacterium]